MINRPGFIIFSLPRSGSTTLAGILSCHPQIRCAYEPFNPGSKSGRILAARAHDQPSFESALREICAQRNGIKHVWDYGLQVPSDERFRDKELLLCGAKVIFLTRRNRLRRLVSVAISMQARSWASTAKAREHNLGFTFTALDLETLQWALEAESAAVAEHRSLLMYSGVEFIDWWYEDLFGEEQTSGERLKKLAKLFSFLGFPMLDAGDRAEAQSRLDPLNGKVNSADTYRRIPNIMEVERRLGCDQTGWLFK